ncbi:MAG: pilus assembly protein N-terminal domain-containing protein, partial [Acidobacteriaceae bacterium]|nr:pilus assembly protein N-terminal domain-containing protein [Acidobacteriaceae bacterium]MBV9296602.1 pilus assembly protein N-terminal domain-containing protein [Acidobacteriaceae bacterium]
MKTLVCAVLFAAVAAAQAPSLQLAAPQLLISRSITLPDQQLPDARPPRRGPADLTVGVSKSFVLDHATPIRRISIANGDIAEAVAVSPTEILLNGKLPGDTSLIIWDSRGSRSSFDVHVSADTSKLDAVRAELSKEVGPDITLTVDGANVFLRGTVKDAIAADRAAAIASTAGKVVNLLRVLVPAVEAQILLKVRFADVDREAALQLGANLFGANLLKGLGSSTTGQFGQPPVFNLGGQSQGSSAITFSQLLNLFYYRPDLGVGAAIQALEAKNVLQVLAEPNLLATSGRQASFLAGGEFPFP